MTGLPRSSEEVRGLRAARWVRESTAGQFDRYGPDAQRELAGRAIARLGLVDTALEWAPAQSGSTVHAGPAMREMLAAARRGEFDVLVVAYVARWQRNLRQTLNLLEDDLHPAGVAVWFADEELLSSNDRHWDQLVDEAKAAESWLRKHRRRVHEGYEAKRARHADPGGHPPYGFVRNKTSKLLEYDPDRDPAIQRVFQLAAEGATDRAISLQLPLPLFTVRGILTSPLYVGRLRTGERAHWPPAVDLDLWERAQAVRARRATNTGRPASRRRPYALPMLRCASCRRRLTGDTGYYRHRAACAAFMAAKPRESRRDGRVDGKGYRREWYEGAVGALLRTVSLRADTITKVVAEVVEPASVPDQLVLARISRERDHALSRYRRDRDGRALEAAMALLDADERSARHAQRGEGIPAARAVSWLGSLADAWAELVDDDGPERAMLARSLFASLEATGFRELGVRLTPEAIAHGFADVLPERFTLTAASCWKESGREVSRQRFPTTGLRIRILDRRVARPLRALRSA